MVLYDSYPTEQIDMNKVEENYIGMGGIATIKLLNDTEVDLMNATVNWNLRSLTGTRMDEVRMGFKPHDARTRTIYLEDIEEIVFEGFYINENNRNNIRKLLKEVKFTKVVREPEIHEY